MEWDQYLIVDIICINSLQNLYPNPPRQNTPKMDNEVGKAEANAENPSESAALGEPNEWKT